MAAPAAFFGQQRGELRLPIVDGFMAECQATDEEHLG
jgi:hypothetical protein